MLHHTQKVYNTSLYMIDKKVYIMVTRLYSMFYNLLFETISTQSDFAACKKLWIWVYFLLQTSPTPSALNPFTSCGPCGSQRLERLWYWPLYTWLPPLMKIISTLRWLPYWRAFWASSWTCIERPWVAWTRRKRWNICPGSCEGELFTNISMLYNMLNNKLYDGSWALLPSWTGKRLVFSLLASVFHKNLFRRRSFTLPLLHYY